MVRVLITEAHDGLGLALVKEYLTDADNQVVAFCGDESKFDQLNTLKRSTSDKQLLIVPVNLADEESIKASVEPIERFVDALDLLIFNTGFMPDGYLTDNPDIPNKEEIALFMPKLADSPLWIKDNLLTILEKGINSKIIGMSPYMANHYLSVIKNYVKKSTRMVKTAHIGFSKFATKVDPNKATVINIWILAQYVLRGHATNQPNVEILDQMNVIEVVGQDAINKKAIALFQNIPHLQHGKHYVEIY